MKTRNLLLVICVVSLALIGMSCESETRSGVNPEGIALESEQGIKIGNSESDLKSRLKIHPEARIVKVDFLESSKVQAAIVWFSEKDSDRIRNLAVATGAISYEASKLRFSGSRPQCQSASGGGNWEIHCTDCDECIVSGTIDPDGALHFQCSRSCCKLVITEITTEE